MEVLASHNIKHIELRGVDWKNVADLTLEEAKSIKKRLDDKGFSISAIGSPIGKYLLQTISNPIWICSINYWQWLMF